MSEIRMDKRKVYKREPTQKEKDKSKIPIKGVNFVYIASKRHKK